MYKAKQTVLGLVGAALVAGSILGASGRVSANDSYANEARFCAAAGRHVLADGLPMNPAEARANFLLHSEGCQEYYGTWIPAYAARTAKQRTCLAAAVYAASNTRGGGAYAAAVAAAKDAGCTVRYEDGTYTGR